MELKSYQQKVIENLEEYLNYVQEHKHLGNAFNQYWEDKMGRYNPLDGTGMQLTTFYLHLKECEFRFNYRKENIYPKLLSLIRNNPLNLS